MGGPEVEEEGRDLSSYHEQPHQQHAAVHPRPPGPDGAACPPLPLLARLLTLADLLPDRLAVCAFGRHSSASSSSDRPMPGEIPCGRCHGDPFAGVVLLPLGAGLLHVLYREAVCARDRPVPCVCSPACG